MKARKYIIYSILYATIVFVLVYTLNNSEYTLSLMGFNINLLIATWFVVPLAFFILLSIFHMAYQNFEIYLQNRALKRDTKIYDEMISEIMLGFDSNKEFKTKAFDNASEVLKSLSPWKNIDHINSKNEDLKEIFNIVKDAKNGIPVDIKKYKLPKENPLYIQNELNKIATLADYYLDILKSNSENINPLFITKAKEKLISTGNYENIMKFNDSFTEAQTLILINRHINKDDKFEIKQGELLNLLKKCDLSENGFIIIAQTFQNKIPPEAIMQTFKNLSSYNQKAQKAYLYILYDLQMLDEIREIVSSSEDDDYLEFKTMLFLRDNGQKAPLKLFFNDRF
ncbi:hypothetical protein [Campylobacter sputorum]|uniref:hypothetical protein n=1 Tax=Campylobacter sputorum TaxID=206 RepID=UPI000B77BF27|nr:hypothetical protein [Campylobacter sputorum]ASM35946.1 putative membrane protein [Campylobacter sputorum bv. faecalis CCUG 20703]